MDLQTASLEMKDSEVCSKEKSKGCISLFVVYLMVVAGFAGFAGMVAAMVFMGGKIQSLEKDYQNLTNQAKEYETQIREMENEAKICNAKKDNLRLQGDGLLKDIRRYKEELQPYHNFMVDKQTNLHTAVEMGYLAMAKLLVQKGANLNAIDSEGKTPLHLAAYDGNLDIVNLLLEHGALKDIKDQKSYTPLVWAEIREYYYRTGYNDNANYAKGNFIKIINLLEGH